MGRDHAVWAAYRETTPPTRGAQEASAADGVRRCQGRSVGHPSEATGLSTHPSLRDNITISYEDVYANRSGCAMPPAQSHTTAHKLFLSHGGILRTSQALRLGIHPETLYAMRDAGVIECVSRGVYRLADAPPLSNPDLAVVAARVPQGVVCLISALSFHELTTEIPRQVDIALRRGSTTPRLESPPVRAYRFSDAAFEYGVESHVVDGVALRVYAPAKTIADCFKYRNKLGLDTALEALRLYLERRDASADALMRAAAVCRVASVMGPYVEALL